jgi:hypothetical protein
MTRFWSSFLRFGMDRKDEQGARHDEHPRHSSPSEAQEGCSSDEHPCSSFWSMSDRETERVRERESDRETDRDRQRRMMYSSVSDIWIYPFVPILWIHMNRKCSGCGYVPLPPLSLSKDLKEVGKVCISNHALYVVSRIRESRVQTSAFGNDNNTYYYTCNSVGGDVNDSGCQPVFHPYIQSA